MCNCSKTAVTEMQTMQETAVRPDGTYALASFDCEGAHHGVYEGRSVYVVGRLSDAEMLFADTALKEAADYMNSLEARPPIQKLAAVTLCDSAVRSVFESPALVE